MSCTFTAVILVYLLVTVTALKPRDFEASLDDHQAIVYDKIKQERLTIFSIGIVSGAILSLLYVRKSPVTYTNCTIFSLTYMFATAFYMVVPKSTYMLTHLHMNQLENYLLVYNRMKIVNSFFFSLAVTSLILKI